MLKLMADHSLAVGTTARAGSSKPPPVNKFVVLN